MPRLVSRVTAWSLVVGVLLLLSMTTSGAVVHEFTHAGHHTAGMHTSAICAWMCAAGQMLDVEQVTPPIRLALLIFELRPIAYTPLHHTVDTPTSRGPPIFSISI